MAGYSNTPLAQKLGLRIDSTNGLLHEPVGYGALLPEYYAAMTKELTGTFDWLQAFYTETELLKREFPQLKEHLARNGQLWISWPKKTSSLVSDLNENIVQAIGLANGLVDVKVAAIDEQWSALKFVYRLRDRK
jgi:hypothetical protein